MVVFIYPVFHIGGDAVKCAIVKWVATPAKWYEFWMPQSGLIGGLIFLSIVMLYAALFYDVYEGDGQ